jgi:serine protease Do
MQPTRRLVISTLLGVTLAALGAAHVAHADPGDQDEARGRAARRTPVVEAVERAAPSVVSIGTTRLVRSGRWWDWDFLQQREVPGALGSGVIVHPRGYVVTNAHVIHQAEQIAVKLTGRGDKKEIPAELVAFDIDNDLALLKLEPAGGPYPAARFGRADDLMVGETIIAMGSPFGLGRTVTTGVVSALERDISIRDQVFENLIQTDAAVNQGNSGGALLNILGEWIGVNSAIYSLSGGSDGISFAIPIETVRTFLVSALRPRRQSANWIGVELREREGGGVEIGTVYAVGPGAKAGLRAGSRIISVGGRPADDPVEAARNSPPSGSRGSTSACAVRRWTGRSPRRRATARAPA